VELVKNINNSVFILKNVFPKKLIENAISIMDSAIINGTFNIRMQYLDDFGKSVDIKKQYNQCDELILEKFNSNDDSVGTHRYCEFQTPNELRNEMSQYYKNALKFIYGEYKFMANESDLFKYLPGSFMKKHCDNDSGKRLCTTILYLNNMEDHFVGGEVLFYNTEALEDVVPIFTYKPNVGDLIIMDSSIIGGLTGTPHSVTMIENWNRYVNRIYWNNIKSLS